MKTNQKLLSLAILIAILGLASCSNKDSESKLSKDEAKSQINDFNSSAVNDLQAISETDGLTALKQIASLTDTDDPFAGNARAKGDKRKVKEVVRETSKKFRKLFVSSSAMGRTKGDEAFIFADHLGVYQWNAQEEIFTGPTESEIDAIQIFFPASEEATSNNAELRITKYSEVAFEDYFEPETLKASVFIDEVEVVSLDFDVEWSQDEFPVKADITFSVKPYSVTVHFDDTSTSESSFSASLKKDQETIIAASVTAKYTNNSKTEENLSKVEGFVQLKNLKVQGYVDVKEVDASESGDPNDFIHLALYSNNSKVGDIVFVSEEVDGDTEFVPYLQYNDGSKEKLEDVLKDVVDEIDELFNTDEEENS